MIIMTIADHFKYNRYISASNFKPKPADVMRAVAEYNAEKECVSNGQ